MTTSPTPEPVVRTFDTGATRDVDHNKLDYEGFLSPLVLESFARYMHGKRRMADGSLRDADNWQKGMPLSAYMKSAYRHFIDWWLHHRGFKRIALEPLETALVALLFNVMGYLHEVLKANLAQQPGPGSITHELPGLKELAAREAGDTTFVNPMLNVSWDNQPPPGHPRVRHGLRIKGGELWFEGKSLGSFEDVLIPSEADRLRELVDSIEGERAPRKAA